MADRSPVDDVLDEAVIGVVPFFVYGTLRPGEPLAYLLEDDTVRVDPAHVNGYVLLNSEQYGFPRMVPGDEGDTVFGDVRWVKNGNLLRWTLEMEARSGYDIAIVPVTTASESEPLPAVVCVTPFTVPGSGRWEPVHSGDWKHRYQMAMWH